MVAVVVGAGGFTQMLCFLQGYHKINAALSVTALGLTSLSTINGVFFCQLVVVAQCSALAVFYKAASLYRERRRRRRRSCGGKNPIM